MDLNLHDTQIHKHQHTAQQLLDCSVVLKQLFQDQWFYLWTITAQNLFEIDEQKKQLSIADGLIKIKFEVIDGQVIHFSTTRAEISVQAIADFVLNEVSFLLRNFKVQHSLFLKTKVQLFRQLLVEEVFKWVDGENRVEQYLYNLSVTEADQIDQIMIDAGYYAERHLTAYATSGTSIPLSVELNFKHLSLVNSILGENFLAVKSLMPVYDQLCFSAEKFIPTDIYRIIRVLFNETFSLANVIDHSADFQLLIEHAQQHPQLLSFTQWMKRGYWQYRDIFSKKNLTKAGSAYWDERISNQFPIFYFNRSVNWLFKQKTEVIDWVGLRLDQIDVRIAVTALSFVDTTHVHPYIIVLTIKYFKSIAGRLFLNDCSRFADQHLWFKSASNDSLKNCSNVAKHHYSLRDSTRIVANDLGQRTEISSSILYLDEWLNLLYLVAKDDQYIVKKIFKRLSSVMQAYMLFMQESVKDLPADLIQFIEPKTQENPQFLAKLRHHQIELREFRKKLKHPILQFNRNTSVFDSYIADYLLDYFSQHRDLAKNVTWSGLYQQAVRWHQQAYYLETLAKLRLKIHLETWRRVSPHEVMFSDHWKFIELNSLEQIIHESNSYKHCLALSYTEQIAEGSYVAFHMTSLEDEELHLTLGCYFKFDQLHFDQLRFPNNQPATQSIENEAKQFIQQVNQYLIWDFKAPKVQ